MKWVLHSKARLESSQDNDVASQAPSLSNDIHFYRAHLSVSAEMISVSNAVSGKTMALDGLVGFTVCFLHLSVLRKQPFSIPWHFLLSAGHIQRYLGANRVKGTSRAVTSSSSCSWNGPWFLEGKWHHSEWKWMEGALVPVQGLQSERPVHLSEEAVPTGRKLSWSPLKMCLFLCVFGINIDMQI